ncbi:MAG: hypothetical protein HXX16_20130 [Bacteroidales bacterium]|nr:hypothetical protein [Bacteroidales bacterium]
MKTAIIVLCIGIFLICACNYQRTDEKSISEQYYYIVFSSKRHSFDTVVADNSRFNFINNLHKLDSIELIFAGKEVKIYKLTNVPEAPLDGEYIGYWEKSVGLFYMKNLSWYSYSLLTSNRDSTVRYINMLMGVVSCYPDMASSPINRK